MEWCIRNVMNQNQNMNIISYVFIQISIDNALTNGNVRYIFSESESEFAII